MCDIRQHHRDIRTRRYARTNEHTYGRTGVQTLLLNFNVLSTSLLLHFHVTTDIRIRSLIFRFFFTRDSLEMNSGHAGTRTHGRIDIPINVHEDIQTYEHTGISPWSHYYLVCRFPTAGKTGFIYLGQHDVFHCIIANRGIQSLAFLGLGRPAL